MTLLINLTVLLVIACISQQLMVANCQGSKKRGMKKKEKEEPKDGEQPKPHVQSPEKKDSSPKGNVFKGRFSAKGKMQCTWVATGDNDFVLSVNCKKGQTSFDCEYVAKPATCPGYGSNTKAYWKQIARALNKNKKLCFDSTALIKAGMCRKAPKDAHFKLNNTPRDIVVTLPRTTIQPRSSPSASSLGAKSCAVDQKRLAEEYCASSWSSLCTFFFTMVQNEDC
ncbi:fibroblast growth factor-binding protein 1-like [Coregonus clupeaformis]|uniref:fibroblast growth factor-binding protein 1-like n=1 Tax=Coregonus clupeaformis TaxID=59861 RepID=UPI001BE0339B|nr:fibroblast growth factor-binding protein 1-like [Coregonus clupeaformis]